MAENNSSAPLKTTPMIEAFEAAYSRDWSDPAGDEIKEIWHRAWQAAVAPQAAPAAVAVTDAQIDAILDEPAGMIFYVSDQRHKQHLFARRVLALANPALPATEDSSAGDLADWAIDVSTGREILVYKNCSVIETEQARFVLSLIRQAVVQAEPVAEVEIFERRGYSASLDRDALEKLSPGKYQLYTAPQAQPADALDAKAPTLVEILAAQWTTWPAEQAVEQTVLGDVFCCVKGRALKFGTYQIASDQDSAVVTPSQWARRRAAMAAAPEGGKAAKEA